MLSIIVSLLPRPQLFEPRKGVVSLLDQPGHYILDFHRGERLRCGASNPLLGMDPTVDHPILDRLLQRIFVEDEPFLNSEGLDEFPDEVSTVVFEVFFSEEPNLFVKRLHEPELEGHVQ